MMFYEFSEHELLSAKWLSKIENVQLIIWSGEMGKGKKKKKKKKGIAFVILSN